MVITLPASIIKRSIIILFLAAAFLIVTQNAYAIDSTSTGAVKREEAKQRVEEKKQLVQNRIDTRREALATKAAALKTRLQTFRDQIKAKVVQKISDALNRINENQTTQMQKHLDKMSSIITRLDKRINESTGSSTASASAAVNDAKSAIASASAAVTAQMAKDYTVTISTESAARAETKATRDRLHTDLRSLRQIVINAKQSVAKAIMTVATTLGGIKSGK